MCLCTWNLPSFPPNQLFPLWNHNEVAFIVFHQSNNPINSNTKSKSLNMWHSSPTAVSGVDGTVSAAGSVAQLWNLWPFIGSSSSWCSSTLLLSRLSTTTSQTGWLKYRVCALLCLFHAILKRAFRRFYPAFFSRCCQQSSSGLVHLGDAGENVQLGIAGLLCIPV